MRRASRSRWIIWLFASAALALVLAQENWWEMALGMVFPHETVLKYPGASLLQLMFEHLELVGFSSLMAILCGVSLGIGVTRPAGREFLPILNNLSAMGQTFPPVAVLALAVPLLGFGLKPTLLALFIYGLLPIIKNTVAGLESVPGEVLEAGNGLGLTRWQILAKIELPLSSQVIIAGIRTSVVINIGTATVGAAFGAGGLGSPIIAGLIQENPALVLLGAIPAALLALLADQILGELERWSSPQTSRL